MMSIVQPLIDAGLLVKVQDELGAAIEPNLIAGGWINNINNWVNTEGYKISVNASTILNVTGTPIVLPLTIGLTGGWNIISYPLPTLQNAMNALNELVVADKLVKVQNEIGAAIEPNLIAGGWIDNIINFMPNEGYKVRLSTPGTLTFNNVGTIPLKNTNTTDYKATLHFKTCWTGNGLDHMNIYLDLVGSGLEAGDEIGIFDGEKCVGSGIVTEEDFISLIASKDDPTTDETDGFIEGNSIQLKAWKYSTEDEQVLSNIEYLNGTRKFYESMGTVFAKATFSTNGLEYLDALSTSLDNCYPNPFQSGNSHTLYHWRGNRCGNSHL